MSVSDRFQTLNASKVLTNLLKHYVPYSTNNLFYQNESFANISIILN